MNVKRLLALVFLPLLAICTLAQAQEKMVTGKVTDSKDGSPLPNITVTIKGTKNATQTNAEGVFRIRVAPGATLVFSAINYATFEAAAGDDLKVQLTSASATLTDVVVVGYGTARKKDVTGSVATITSKDFQSGQISTPEQLIAGKVPGVQISTNGGAPGAGSTIRIRGGASLNASNDPLIIIDGMPLSNDGIAGAPNPLSLINPNDIETFTVLKDASAAAIYGSRASNGVILITTKKGKKGAPQINFSTNLSSGTVANTVSVLTADQVRSLVAANAPASVGLLGTANTNWQDQIYQNAITTDNNLSISGAHKGLPYRVSLGYLNQQGVLRTGNLQRTSLGINLNPSLFKNHLKIDVSLKGSYNKSFFANEGAIGSAVTFDPTQSVRNDKSNRFGGYWEWLDPASRTGLKALAPRNPMGLLMQNDNRSEVKRSIGNAVFDYKLHFLPDVRAVLNVGYDISEGTGTIIVNDSAASAYKRFQDANGVLHGGVNNQYKQTKNNNYLNFYLNYAKDFKAIKSRLEAMAGYEYQYYSTTDTYFPDYTFNKTLVTGSEPNFPNNTFESRIISFLGRVNYTFDNKVVLTASVRRDGSSRFAKENRWGTFPSGALAWKLKETFFPNAADVSEFKLRVGYGVTGQQDGIGLYDYISYYSLSTPTAQYQFGDNFFQMQRPGGYYQNRKWEQTASSNIGIDFGFFKNRITGSIEYYYKNTTDLLNSIVQPAGTNFTNRIVANVGSMENRGVEFSINFQPIRTEDVTLDLAFNATFNRNKITKLTISNDPSFPGNLFGGIAGGVGNVIMINTVGFNRGSFYTLKQIYDKDGKPIEDLFEDLNRDGVINSSDRYQYKQADPQSFYGFTANLRYKKWNAGFVLRASEGNYVYNNIASNTGTIRNIINPIGFINNGSSDVLNTGFTGRGDRYFLSDYYVQNASFLRMDNINVGYDAGKVFKSANLRISANVQNVFVITKYKGLDPEVSGGIDNNFYPRPRTFTIGLNLAF